MPREPVAQRCRIERRHKPFATDRYAPVTSFGCCADDGGRGLVGSVGVDRPAHGLADVHADIEKAEGGLPGQRTRSISRYSDERIDPNPGSARCRRRARDLPRRRSGDRAGRESGTDPSVTREPGAERGRLRHVVSPEPPASAEPPATREPEGRPRLRRRRHASPRPRPGRPRAEVSTRRAGPANRRGQRGRVAAGEPELQRASLGRRTDRLIDHRRPGRRLDRSRSSPRPRSERWRPTPSSSTASSMSRT